MTQGRQAGRNIRNEVRGRSPGAYRFTGLGDACGLGRRRAVAQLKGIPVTGLPAWILWRTFFLRFVPTMDRRLRILLDWMLTPFFGRDVVEMSIREPFGVRRQHYEAGQDIVRQGEHGQQLYFIWKGVVEVLQDDAEGRRRLAQLGAGEHFGEMSVFQGTRRTATVRAVTPVDIIAVGAHEARVLGEISRPFGEEVERLPGSGGAP